MRHPFWLINSILALLVLFAFIFIFLSSPKVPPRSKIYPEPDIKSLKKPVQKVDLAKIYENDLFGSYKDTPAPIKAPDYTSPIPKPPEPKPIRVPIAGPPKFLEPLPIVLNGILTVSNDAENTAIIQDAKTKSSKNYHVGDKIIDAQIIRIMQNKIILIRSNGQQETLYVSKYDAEHDRAQQDKSNWDTISKKESLTKFLIDPNEFILHVTDLAQLIDELNLTTVYERGKSTGCRIGRIAQDSLAVAIGLQAGDIITAINSIPATDTDSRLRIYENVVNKKIGDSIGVTLIRGQRPVALEYVLTNLVEQQAEKSPPQAGQLQKIEDKKIAVLKEQKKFAPTLNELQKEAKQNLMKHGKKRDRRNQNILLNNAIK